MSKYLVPLLCGTALVLPAQALAQTDGGGARLEEIVVTARKREETLQTVPVAVSVVSAQALKNNLASDLTKIGELAPQVTMTSGGSGTGAIIAIRGVASSSSDAGIDQSVAVEVDGVPLSRGRIIGATLFDMASVQVLQGPQALFFGKNSPAGVISLRTANPTSEFEGYVTAGYEFEAREKFVEGAISGPISDTLKARLAFRASDLRGWIKNIATPTPDIINPSIMDPGANQGRWGPDNRNLAGRLTVVWTPTEDFDATLKVSLDQLKKNHQLANTEPFCVGGQTVPVTRINAGNPSGTVIPGGDCEKNQVKTHAGVAPQYAANVPYANGGVPYFDSKYGLISLVLNKRFGNLNLTSTTGYYDQIVKAMGSTDWAPYSQLWASQKEGYRLFTQEVRLETDFDGPFNVMGGVYVENYTRQFLNSPDIFGHLFNPVAGNYASLIMSSETKGDYLSAFGQATWAITPSLELSGGARWSKDKKEIAIVNLAALAGFGQRPVGLVLPGKYKDSHISPEATLTWRPTSRQTAYAAFKTGYKAGGLSNPFLPSATATSALSFQPEKVKGFEVGYKATLLDGAMRFDVTAYRYNYDGLQVVAFTPPASYVLQNAASARIQGVQGSAEWLLTENLTVRGNFGLNSAKYRKFTNAQCYQQQNAAEGCVGGVQDLSGVELFNAPKLTFSVGGDYRLAEVAGWKTTLGASVTRSSRYNATTDHSPGGEQKRYWLLNASVRTSLDDGRYEMALIGRNLTNSYYLANVTGWSGSNAKNQYVGFFNRPREVVLQGTVRF